MTNYQIRAALWQIPTMVANPNVPDNYYQFDQLTNNALNNIQSRERLRILEDVVDRAVAHFRGLATPQGARVLDIFVAPEYLFTESDQVHFVSEKTKDVIVKGLRAISERNRGLLLVPGTVAWKKPALRGTLAQLLLPDRGKRAEARRDAASANSTGNITATSRQKFQDARQGGQQYYLGENTAFVVRNNKVVLKYHKRYNGGEVNGNDGADTFWSPGVRDSFFSVEGMDLGVQICAEHRFPMGKDVDIHILISASHPYVNNCGEARQGGYLMHADAVLEPEIYQLGNAGYTKVPVGQPFTASPLTAQQVQQRTAAAAILNPATAKGSMDQAAAAAARVTEEQTALGGRLYCYNLSYQK